MVTVCVIVHDLEKEHLFGWCHDSVQHVAYTSRYSLRQKVANSQLTKENTFSHNP